MARYYKKFGALVLRLSVYTAVMEYAPLPFVVSTTSIHPYGAAVAGL